MRFKFISLLILTIFGFSSIRASEAKSVMVFAAASTTNVMGKVVQNFQLKYNIELVTSFAASSTLARQIEKGAPVDIYISANLKWMNYLESKGLITDNNKMVLFSNRLVLISSHEQPIKVTINQKAPLKKLLGGGYLALANPDHTPVGIYAKQSLKKLGLWKMLERQIARTKDVRAALMLVERKESPLGIVYLTDAKISKRVNVVGIFPADSHSPIIYLCALIGEKQKPASKIFFQYLQSEESRKIYQHYGFSLEVK